VSDIRQADRRSIFYSLTEQVCFRRNVEVMTGALYLWNGLVMTAPRTNVFLQSLSAASRNEILSLTKEVSLPVRTYLQRQEEIPQYAYFLTSGIASYVVALAEGFCVRRDGGFSKDDMTRHAS
jgi:hypothetical protein